MPLVPCSHCGFEFYSSLHRLSVGRGKYCSKVCYDICQTGLKHPTLRKGSHKSCKSCGTDFYCRKSQMHRIYCSRRCAYSNKPPVSLETKERLRSYSLSSGVRPPSQKGKKFSLEHRRAMSVAGIKRHENLRKAKRDVRDSFEYKEWRKGIFERDGYTCVICGRGNRNGNRTTLNADHILPFALYPDLRFSPSNGRTLCVDCHKKTPTYMNRWMVREHQFATVLEKLMALELGVDWKIYDQAVSEL